MTNTPLFFEQILPLRLARARLGQHDFLHQLTSARLRERLDDVQLPLADSLFCGHAAYAPRPGMVCAGPLPADLPTGEKQFDLIITHQQLHYINDVAGYLHKLHHLLRPGGLLLGSFCGAATLRELSDVLLRAELAICGGAAQRTHPMIGPADAAGLLQRAGFTLPVVDDETIEATYTTMLALLHELRGMGATNLTQGRRRPLRRDVLALAGQLYRENHSSADGRLNARFDLVFLHGWRAAH